MFERNCPIMERTADNVPVGRCWYYLKDGRTCPRHGDVTAVVLKGMSDEDLSNLLSEQLATEEAKKHIKERRFAGLQEVSPLPQFLFDVLWEYLERNWTDYKKHIPLHGRKQNLCC